MKYTVQNTYTHKNYNLPNDYCQSCITDGYTTDPYYVFNDETGNEHTIPGFSWDNPHGYGNIMIDEEELDRFSLWLDNTDIIVPQHYDFDWFAHLHERFSRHDEVYSDFAKDESEKEYAQNVIQWIDKNIIVDDNVSKISFENEDIIPMIEDTMDMLKYAGAKLPQYDLFVASENNLFEFLDDTCYVGLRIFGFDNKVKIEFAEYDAYGKRLYRDNDNNDYEDEVEIGDIPCAVSLTFKDDSTIPDITVYNEGNDA